ncbi:MAG: glycosyltransferase 87 family protein [Propionibacteriaceae bacterium]
MTTSVEGRFYRQTWFMVLVWVVAHLAMVGIWPLTDAGMNGDVVYYSSEMQSFPYVGLDQTMTEYPTPVVWFFELIRLASFGNNYIFQALFSVLMAACDLAMTVALWRAAGPRRELATYFWIAFVFAIGPLVYFRFDMVPAVLVGLALLWLVRRPTVAGGLLGLGAAVKLWPALLILALASARKERRRTLTGFCGVGFGLAALSFLAAGWDRLVSPLLWQKGRGLQVESILATPYVFLRSFTTQPYTVRYSRYQAFEIFGPGVDSAIKASSYLTLLGLLLIVLFCVRLWALPTKRHATITLVAIIIVAVMIVTNKTLSPQYILWLGGPIAVLLSIWRTPLAHGLGLAHARLLAIATIALGLLTQWVYPICYYKLVMQNRGSYAGALAIVIRNSYLLLWSALFAVIAWRATRRTTQNCSEENDVLY